MSKDPSSVELRVSALEATVREALKSMRAAAWGREPASVALTAFDALEAERDRLAARVEELTVVLEGADRTRVALAARVSELEAALRQLDSLDWDDDVEVQRIARAALDKDLAATFDEEPE